MDCHRRDAQRYEMRDERIPAAMAEELAAVALTMGLPTSFDDAADLRSIGIDSLGFALFFSRMIERTGIDPFVGDLAELDLPKTVGDIARFFERAKERDDLTLEKGAAE